MARAADAGFRSDVDAGFGHAGKIASIFAIAAAAPHSGMLGVRTLSARPLHLFVTANPQRGTAHPSRPSGTHSARHRLHGGLDACCSRSPARRRNGWSTPIRSARCCSPARSAGWSPARCSSCRSHGLVVFRTSRPAAHLLRGVSQTTSQTPAADRLQHDAAGERHRDQLLLAAVCDAGLGDLPEGGGRPGTRGRAGGRLSRRADRHQSGRRHVPDRRAVTRSATPSCSAP